MHCLDKFWVILILFHLTAICVQLLGCRSALVLPGQKPQQEADSASEAPLTSKGWGNNTASRPRLYRRKDQSIENNNLNLPAVHWRGALPIPPKRELYPLRLGLVPDSVHFSQGHVGKETALFYRMVLEIGKPAAELLAGSA